VVSKGGRVRHAPHPEQPANTGKQGKQKKPEHPGKPEKPEKPEKSRRVSAKTNRDKDASKLAPNFEGSAPKMARTCDASHGGKNMMHKDPSISKTSLGASHCNTLQHTATHCDTLSNTATHCNTLQHTATHCSTL